MRAVTLSVRLNTWAERLREQRESGMTVRAWCQGKGYTEKTFHHWKRKLREAACEQLEQAQNTVYQPNPMPIRFAEVQIQEQQNQLALQSSAGAGKIRIEVGGILINADSGYPPEHMAILLQRLARP